MDSKARNRLLIVADYQGWAWDHKARNLKSTLSWFGFDTEIIYSHDLISDSQTSALTLERHNATGVNYEKYDKVIFFSKFMEPMINSSLDFHKAYIGICSHQPYNGDIANTDDVDFLNQFAGVFVNNSFLYREWAQAITRLYYCPNGVDVKHFHPKEPLGDSNELVVGWVGDCGHKNMKGFEEYIMPLGRLNNVEIRFCDKETNRKSYSEMPDFYNTIDVYVCASKTEGTPNPCLEAAACGRPIISTAVGNMPEFIRNNRNGFLVDRSLSALCQHVTLLRDNRILLKNMGREARESAIEWSWDNQTQNYLQMLTS